jgi:hypothetical protein
MRNQAMIIPGVNWWRNVKLTVFDLAGRIRQADMRRCLCESLLLLGVLSLMSICAVGSLVLVACSIAEAMGGTR